MVVNHFLPKAFLKQFPVVRNLSPLTRKLALFVLINGFAVSMAIALFSDNVTVLKYSRDFFRLEANNDSWKPMRAALDYLHRAHTQPLYQQLFFALLLHLYYLRHKQQELLTGGAREAPSTAGSRLEVWYD